MAEARTDIAHAKWQVTATTVKCEMVDDLVTIMVYGDWSCRCVWWNRYKREDAEHPRGKPSRDIRPKLARCQGPDCPNVISYRDKLIAEEKATLK